MFKFKDNNNIPNSFKSIVKYADVIDSNLNKSQKYEKKYTFIIILLDMSCR